MPWWKNKQVRPALWVLAGMLLIALARDILANGRPLYCRIDGQRFFPGLQAIWRNPDLPYGHPVLDSIQRGFLWRKYEFEAAVFAPVAFSPGELPMTPDTTIRRALPGAVHPGVGKRSFRHWLGTDVNGYDVAAGMIGGARIALLAGAIAMGLAFSIGLFLGAIAGYWGDDRLRVRRGMITALIPGMALAVFYSRVAWQEMQTGAFRQWGWLAALVALLVVAGMFLGVGLVLSRWSFFSKKITLPADLIIMRLAEVFTSVPGLLAIVAFAAMLRDQTQSLWAMIGLIGAFSWPGVALFIRAELLRIRELDYIQAARGIGLSEWRILFRHALPNAMRPAYTIFAFGVAGAILLEATLSFLGYGDQVFHGASWGSLLQNARSSPQLWWISLPPGLAICIIILALHRVGESLSDRF